MNLQPHEIAALQEATEGMVEDLDGLPEEARTPPEAPPPAPAPRETAASPEAALPETRAPAAAPSAPAPPAQPERHDGWTRDKQVRFLQALAATHNVSAAAREVGLSRQSAYKLRTQLRGQPFDLAWDAAFQCAWDALAEAAMDRAINGVEVPHLHQGEVVHTSRRYDERLTIALLALRHQPRRAPPPSWHPASGYRADDLEPLLARVANGPAAWQRREDGPAAFARASRPERIEDRTGER